VRAFYDTNVLLDVLLAREPFYGDSAGAWTLAETGQVEGYASALSFVNVFYLVAGLRDGEEARRAVGTMAGIFTPATCDAAVIRHAVDARLPDFEDAVQYFSAVHAGADCILSRDWGGYPRRPAVPVVSPAEFLAGLQLD
jgi:predicted nucleic acid-binding protein